MIIKKRRGQFEILAAFMVLVIMTSAAIAAINKLQDNPFKEPVTLATTIKSVDNSLHELLGFTAGYYGSIIKLTGNVTYAKEKTNSYFDGGLYTVAHSDINNGISLKLDQLSVKTTWFGVKGITQGSLSVEYSIPSVGLTGVKYLGSASLTATVLETTGDVCKVKVLGDNDEPNLSLTKDSFTFLKYDRTKTTWVYLTSKYDPMVSSLGIYSINIPSGINRDAYYLQVIDQRGIIVSCGYMRGVGNANKEHTYYTYTFHWNQTLYSGLNEPPMEIELLQDGTMRWLGQALPVNGTQVTIPPIPVKGIHLNETVDGVNKEVPFQIESWGSNYQLPFGIVSNSTIFNENCMIVFLIDHHVSQATLWWDGSDDAVQTSYATRNTKFTNDDPTHGKIDNGVLSLDVSNFRTGVISTTKTSPITSTCTFTRVNGTNPVYGSAPSYIIHHGVVRDIVQQEPEWSGGISSSPDFYGYIVLTIPAGANYYTYRVRLIYLPTTRSRILSDVSVIQLKEPTGTYNQKTEDGIQGGSPKWSSGSLFFQGGTAYQHQWTEYINSTNRGVGIITTSSANDLLYTFDDVIGANTGAISFDASNRRIEVNPVDMLRFPFQQGDDLTWVGGVVNFSSGNLPIYPNSGGTSGLWVLVESPPSVKVS